jgi:transmembrane sensor
MSELQYPLKDHLQDPVDEEALYRMAEEIDSRLRGPKPRRFLPLALVGATAALAILVGVSRLHRDTGPLLLADGRELVAMDASGSAKEIDLSDGSRIRLSPGARIEPLQSSGATFSAIVTQGRADFDVRPGGSRRWVVECGLATIEVLGTVFACEREPGRLRVVVRRGVVLVRGERVPDRARRLSAGETLEVMEEAQRPAHVVAASLALAALPQNAGSSGPTSAETAVRAPGQEAGASRSRTAPATTWRVLAQHGRHREAFAALGTEGLRRESKRMGVDDLLALADVARLSGHPAEAVLPLGRILTEFANDAHAPLAAFALGRLELDSLSHPQAAVTAFGKALDLGIPRSLREDARARLVEAYARSGDTGAARRAADAYHDEFPSGRHARAIQGWLHLQFQ